MRFTLIKVKPGGNTTLKWEAENTVDRNDSMETKVSTDEAQPALEEALAALRPDVCKLLDGLPKGWASSLEIRTLSFNWKDGRYAVVVSMVRELGTNNKPLNISTPQFSQPADEEGEGGAGIIPGSLGKKLARIFELADELRQDIGTRLDPQLTLEMGDGKEEDTDEPEETDAEPEEGRTFRAGEIPDEEEVQEPEEDVAPAAEGEDGPTDAADDEEAPEGVEIFRDGARRKLEAGKTLIVVGSNGIHSGDHLRVLAISQDKKKVSVALWADPKRVPVGVVRLDDLGWSQQHSGFLAVHVDWAGQEDEEPGPFDAPASEEQEEAAVAS